MFFLHLFLTVLLSVFLPVVQSTVPDLRASSFWTMFPPGRLALTHAHLHHPLYTNSLLWGGMYQLVFILTCV